MSDNIERYRVVFDEWMAAREASGGELTEDQESDWTEKVDAVWRVMTEDEREAAELYVLARL